MTNEQAVAQAAGALQESAKTHKRAAGMHRKSARKCMDALRQLRETCAALGIRLVVAEHPGGEHGQE